MGLPAAAYALPDRRAAARQFQRAARAFGAASFLHDEARSRLLDRLDLVDLRTGTLVDLGAGHAAGARELVRRYPDARVVAIDSSPAMLGSAGRGGFGAVIGAAERLPLADASATLVLANLLLPWCDPMAVFTEVVRVLAPGGLLLFSSVGPDTLAEVRRAFGRADDAVHVHGFVDMHDLGDLALRAGLEEPVLDVERIRVTYPDVTALIRDLRSCGATNVAAGRRRTLTGVRRWREFERELQQGRRDGRLEITVELILGQAFGRRARGRDDEVRVPIGSIGGRRA